MSKILSVNFLENEPKWNETKINENDAKAWGSNNNCLWTTKIFKDMVKDQIVMQLTNYFTPVTEHFKIIIRIKTNNILLWHTRFLGIPIIYRVYKTFPWKYSLRMFITIHLKCFPCNLTYHISLVSSIF